MSTFTDVPRGSRQLALRLAAVATAMSFVAACGGAGAAEPGAAPKKTAPAAFAATRLEPVALPAGEALPLTKKPILAVRGNITRTNDGDALQLGADTLDQLGLLKVRTYEPWTKKRMSFQGVWLADLLKVAGVATSARTVHLVALDDYQVDLTIADITAGGIFLATKSEDGSPIPIDQGGPTRIVFMEGVKAGASADQWIWSLKDLDVR